jgi:putative SOS response-associated peptidase YedK
LRNVSKRSIKRNIKLCTEARLRLASLTSPHPPLAAFAGIWRPWTGVRGTKADPVEGEHLLYSFLAPEPNGVAGPIDPKAMPVILTTPGEYDV